MKHLNYPLTLAAAGASCDRDAARTEFAQRKAGRGIRLETRRGISAIARSVSNGFLPVTAHALRRFAQ